MSTTENMGVQRPTVTRPCRRTRERHASAEHCRESAEPQCELEPFLLFIFLTAVNGQKASDLRQRFDDPCCLTPTCAALTSFRS